MRLQSLIMHQMLEGAAWRGGDGRNVNGQGDVSTAAVVEVMASASLALL